MAKQIIRHLEFYGFPDQNNFMSEPCIDSCIDRKQDWEIHKIAHDLYEFRHFQHGFNDKTIEINNEQNKKINELVDGTNSLESAVTKNSQDIITINGTIDEILDAIANLPISSITEDVEMAIASIEAVSGDLATNYYTKTEIDTKFNATETAITNFKDEFDVYTAETDTAIALKANTDDVYTKNEVDDLIGGSVDDMATKTWVKDQEYLTEASGDTLYVRKLEYTAYTASTGVRLANFDFDINALKHNLGDLSADTAANFNTLNNTVLRIDGELQNHISGNITDIASIRSGINTLDSRLTNDESVIATKADRATTDAQYNDLNSKLNGKTDSSAFTNYQVEVNATLTVHQNDLTRLDNVKADKTAVTNSFNDEIAAREAADNFLSGKVDTNISKIAVLESKDVDHEDRMDDIEADLAQEVTNRQNGDTALIGVYGDASTASTIYGAKKYADEREAAANGYTNTVASNTYGQAQTYTDGQISNVRAEISAYAKTSDVINYDNQVRTDMQTLITQTATSVNQLVTAEADRANSVEASLRNDINSLSDSFDSVDNLVHKITDWDGTGTYTGSGNGAMDIMHQELHNLITQFNGLIATLTQKGILP